MHRSATHGRIKGQTPRGDSRPGPRTIRYRSSLAFLADYETFVSHGRLFVNTRHPLPEGSPVRVTLACESEGIRLTLEGIVLRSYRFGNPTNDMPGMLVELREFDRPTTEHLHEMARTLREAHPCLPPGERLHGGASL